MISSSHPEPSVASTEVVERDVEVRKEVLTVVHVRASIGLYGAERVILNLATHCDKQRFRIILLCLKESDGRSEPFLRKAAELKVPLVAVGTGRKLDLRALHVMRHTIRVTNASIVHAHDFKSDLYTLIATAGLRVKRVATAHGTTRDSLSRKLYLLVEERLLYQGFDTVVAVAERLRSRLASSLGPKRVAVIPNGIDTRLLQHDAAPAGPAPPLPTFDGTRVFGIIGRLLPDKGHRFFLEAFRDVLRTHPGCAALIVGDGPEHGALARTIESLGLERQVILCGPRTDMRDVYDRLDYLVIPSLTEGLPNVLLEAFALNVPVLATTVGDIPLLVRHGHSGYLVPPGDAPALASGMRALLDDPQRASAMAKAALTILHEKFTAQRMAKETQKLYDQLLEKAH